MCVVCRWGAGQAGPGCQRWAASVLGAEDPWAEDGVLAGHRWGAGDSKLGVRGWGARVAGAGVHEAGD